MTKLFTKSCKTKVKRMLKKEDHNAPTVVIGLDALLKMKGYVSASSVEIGWLCASKRLENNNFFIYETFTCEQEVSATTAELHEAGLQKLAEWLISQNRADELNNVKTWGHSHVNMTVNASGTDDATFEEYYKDCDYFIRLIMNKKGDVIIDVADSERGVIYYDVNWTILMPEELQEIYNAAEEARAQAEEMKKVAENFEKTFQDSISDLVKKYEDEAKVEKESVTKQRTYTYSEQTKKGQGSGKYGTYNYEDDDDYGYGYGYGYGSYSSKKNANYYDPLFVYAWVDGQYKPMPIDSLFEDNELVDLYGWSDEDLKEHFKDDERFKFYMNRDWTDLEIAIWTYAQEYGISEEYEEETDKKGNAA